MIRIVYIGSGFHNVHYGIIGTFTFGDSYYLFMVNGSGSLQIVHIYYEKDLTLIEFVSLGKV